MMLDCMFYVEIEQIVILVSMNSSCRQIRDIWGHPFNVL